MSNHSNNNPPRRGIPIVIVGRGEQAVIEVTEALRPEYDTVHACIEVDAAIKELPGLLSGSQDVVPSSNIGSNISREAGEPHPVPKAVLVGGGVTPGDYEKIREAVKREGNDVSERIVWLKSTPEHYPRDIPADGPPVELIVQVARNLLREISG